MIPINTDGIGQLPISLDNTSLSIILYSQKEHGRDEHKANNVTNPKAMYDRRILHDYFKEEVIIVNILKFFTILIWILCRKNGKRKKKKGSATNTGWNIQQQQMNVYIVFRLKPQDHRWCQLINYPKGRKEKKNEKE